MTFSLKCYSVPPSFIFIAKAIYNIEFSMTSVSLKSLNGTAFFANKNGVGRQRRYREKVKIYLLDPDKKLI